MQPQFTMNGKTADIKQRKNSSAPLLVIKYRDVTTQNGPARRPLDTRNLREVVATHLGTLHAALRNILWREYFLKRSCNIFMFSSSEKRGENVWQQEVGVNLLRTFPQGRKTSCLKTKGVF